MIAVRRVQFCAGHRVYRHESKCAHLHGHNYVAFFHAEGIAAPLDQIGRVVDFSVLKEELGGWIDENLDHGFLVWERDAEVRSALDSLGHKRFVMQENPTAENIAALLLEVGNGRLARHGVRLVRVVLWETENCYAEVRA